jgi:hypothetical protein
VSVAWELNGFIGETSFWKFLVLTRATAAFGVLMNGNVRTDRKGWLTTLDVGDQELLPQM